MFACECVGEVGVYVYVAALDIRWECVHVHRSVLYCGWIFFSFSKCTRMHVQWDKSDSVDFSTHVKDY